MRGQIARDPDHSVQIQSGSMDPLAAYSGSADPLAAYFMHFPFCASPHMVVPYIIIFCTNDGGKGRMELGETVLIPRSGWQHVRRPICRDGRVVGRALYRRAARSGRSRGKQSANSNSI